MALYLRDQRLKNMTINAESIALINSVFVARQNALNTGVPDSDTDKKLILNYIIRFDNKGYRVFLLNELLQYFNEAKEVERVIFTVETPESVRTNRQLGTYLELRLDKDANACILTVTSNDKDFVDTSFCAVQDVLIKCKNKYGWVRSAWTLLGVQITAVTLMFVLSLWAAAKIAPKLSIANAFIIAFLFMLLIFSNLWTYLNPQILLLLNSFFPNMKFYRPGRQRLYWLMQAVIGGIVLAVVLYLLSLSFSFLLDMLGSFVNKNP